MHQRPICTEWLGNSFVARGVELLQISNARNDVEPTLNAREIILLLVHHHEDSITINLSGHVNPYDWASNRSKVMGRTYNVPNTGCLTPRPPSNFRSSNKPPMNFETQSFCLMEGESTKASRASAEAWKRVYPKALRSAREWRTSP